MSIKVITLNRDKHIKATLKWMLIFILLLLSAFGINKMHQEHIHKLAINSDLLKQKTYLIARMHREMLLISNMQFKILHASKEQQVKEDLRQLSGLVADHLSHYYQLKNIANESDVELLTRFKIGYKKWHDFNQSLISYAKVVSDTGFIKTLNLVDLTLGRLDQDENKSLLVVSQLR